MLPRSVPDAVTFLRIITYKTLRREERAPGDDDDDDDDDARGRARAHTRDDDDLSAMHAHCGCVVAGWGDCLRALGVASAAARRHRRSLSGVLLSKTGLERVCWLAAGMNVPHQRHTALESRSAWRLVAATEGRLSDGADGAVSLWCA